MRNRMEWALIGEEDYIRTMVRSEAERVELLILGKNPGSSDEYFKKKWAERQAQKAAAIARFKNAVRNEISKEDTMTRVSKVITKKVKGIRGKSPSVPLKTKGEERKATRNDKPEAKAKALTAEEKKGQGQRLGFFAKVGGFTLKEMAEKTKIAYPRMKKIAQGLRELLPEEKAKLEKVSNINIEWLENGGRALIMARPVLGRRAK